MTTFDPSTLAATREARGVSLEEIAARTRIPLRHLQELERGDVSRWPPGVYARSWARAYAEEAGADAGAVVAFVSSATDLETSTEAIGRAREMHQGGAGSYGGGRLMARVALVLVVLAVIAAAAVYVWRAAGPEAEAEAAPATDQVGAVTPRPL